VKRLSALARVLALKQNITESPILVSFVREITGAIMILCMESQPLSCANLRPISVSCSRWSEIFGRSVSSTCDFVCDTHSSVLMSRLAIDRKRSLSSKLDLPAPMLLWFPISSLVCAVVTVVPIEWCMGILRKTSVASVKSDVHDVFPGSASCASIARSREAQQDLMTFWWLSFFTWADVSLQVRPTVDPMRSFCSSRRAHFRY